MKRTTGKGLVLIGALLTFVWVAQSPAQEAGEDHLKGHALRYAGMIERAYGRLHGHIRNRSSAATSWSGAAVPPAATGWESIWTDVGVRARYCENHLVVYMAPAEAKGVGENHRAIQQARRTFLPERESGVKLPMLSWLVGDVVTDSNGDALALPGCMAADYTEPMPLGRAALASVVADPWTDVRERETFEPRTSVCPAGEHGVVRERRAITQEFNRRGDPTGPEVFGPWLAAPGSWCRADYTYYEVYTEQCEWDQGPPFNKTMTGTETWRIPIVVTGDPNALGEVVETPGTAEFVSTTCWGGPPPTPPVPVTNVASATETRTLTCPTGFEGSIGEQRTRTTATTTYPWGGSPLVSVEYTNWSETSNTCTEIVPEDPKDHDQDGMGPGGNANGPGPGPSGPEGE